jgi:hypothetical protein
MTDDERTETPLQAMLRKRDAHQAALFQRIVGDGELAHYVLGDETVGVQDALSQGTAPKGDDDEVTDEKLAERAALYAREMTRLNAENARRAAAEEAKRPKRRSAIRPGPQGTVAGIEPVEPDPDEWLRRMIDGARTYPD